MTRPPQILALWLAAAMVAAASLWIAARTDAWLAPGPRFDPGIAPLVIEGEELTECLPAGSKRAGVIARGVRLYANVDLTLRVVVPEIAARPGAGPMRFWVVARGRPLDGAWPLLTLHVDGRYRGGVFVSSRDWKLYGVDADLSSGEHHLRISYVNDRPGFPGKRDVDVRLVGLGDPGSLIGKLPRDVERLTGAPAGPADHPEAETIARAEPLQLSRTDDAVATEFDLDSGSGSVPGARVLWSNGYLGRTVVAPKQGPWRMVARVRGDECEGEGPRALLLLGDDQISSWRVESGDYQDLVLNLYLAPGAHELLLVYDNDRRVAGVCDRNLYVAELRFEPTAILPEGDE